MEKTWNRKLKHNQLNIQQKQNKNHISRGDVGDLLNEAMENAPIRNPRTAIEDQDDELGKEKLRIQHLFSSDHHEMAKKLFYNKVNKRETAKKLQRKLLKDDDNDDDVSKSIAYARHVMS